MSGWEQVGLSLWERAEGEKAALAMFAQAAHQEPFRGLVFDYPEDEDGLGFAGVRLPSQVLVSVIDDPENAIQGVVLFRVGQIDEQAVLREFVGEFDIGASDVKWIAGQSMPIDF
ncbi:hypothetical protein [Streptomyces sp. NEAU-H3]|uniref:hypothetical protein n=1 Tax=Streptomyces sp. NEAU-H3 TaxID=2720636 RepID=UPI001439CB4D|nr:hypothetical protein [Streptomyces sp. NEAU-H3]NJA56990.1 hypothetical protein [Streptomyces sp. NEAU-H3]